MPCRLIDGRITHVFDLEFLKRTIGYGDPHIRGGYVVGFRTDEHQLLNFSAWVDLVPNEIQIRAEGIALEVLNNCILEMKNLDRDAGLLFFFKELQWALIDEFAKDDVGH